MNATPRLLVLILSSALAACSNSNSSGPATVSQLAVGDAHCPNGGVAITSGSATGYACTGADGLKGDTGNTGVPGPKGDPGAQGAQGVQGIPGGGYYTKLSDAYCRSVEGPTDASGHLIVRCDQPQDLPLTGSCVSKDEAHGLVYTSDPRGWGVDGSSTPAGWDCGYGINGQMVPTPFAGAKATVCCVKHF